MAETKLTLNAKKGGMGKTWLCALLFMQINNNWVRSCKEIRNRSSPFNKPATITSCKHEETFPEVGN